MRKLWEKGAAVVVAATLALGCSPAGVALASGAATSSGGDAAAASDDAASGYTVVINEVESSDADGGNDWIEIINIGTQAVNISGWYVSDDGGTARLTEGETTAFADGTTLQPGQILVLEEGTNFTCGLGKADTAALYDASGNLVDSYSWSAHASGTYARVSDGVGSFVDQAATKGTLNDPSVVVINEVESNDADGGNDWVEIKNVGGIPVYITGWYLVDDGGTARLTDAETTPISVDASVAAGGYYVFEETVDFTFGLGKADTASVYDGGNNLVATYSWTAHASVTYGRIPDGTGEMVETTTATKGASNDVDSDEDGDSDGSGDSDDADDTLTTSGNVVINEANSNPDDWVELYNNEAYAVDLSGWVIEDADDNAYTLPEGTSIEAAGILLISQSTTDAAGFDFGLGKEDGVYLYDASGALVDSVTWNEHASYDGDTSLASVGRYPDGTGSFCITKETPGEANEWYAPTVAINEIESSDADGGEDWVELYNYGTEDVDLSGWYVLDDDASHTPQALADGTTLAAGAYLVLTDGTDFDFGLGKADSVTLYNADGTVIDSYSWTAHASGTYSRIPDGTGEFTDAEPTKGATNFAALSVVVNEVESSDADGGEDWIELANTSDEIIDISGLVLADADGGTYTLPEGTTLAASGFLVLYQSTFGFGLGSSDGVYLYQDGTLISSVEWTEHASTTLGLYPNVNGSEYRETASATPGAANDFDIPETIEWQGSQDVTTISDVTLLADTSGLDFFDGQLYVVDNDEGRFWIFDVEAETGALSYAEGYEDGLVISGFLGSDGSEGVADAEGITVTNDGSMYVAAERDNNYKGANYNVVVQVDPATGQATAQWDITSLMPDVSANYGVEAVEWVSNDAAALLVDDNTGKAFDAAYYPNAVSGGVFFVALEANGLVYAFVLNSDGTAELISTIDTQMGAAMALDYDEYEGVLWVVTDEACSNLATKVTLNGTDDPDMVYVSAPANMDTAMTNEAFCIVSEDYAVNGQRWVYRGQDGPTSGQLSIGTVATSYVVDTSELEAVLAEAGALESVCGAEDAFALLEAALAEAEAVCGSAATSYAQVSVDAAASELAAAVEEYAQAAAQAGHVLTAHPAVAAGCTEDGIAAYWSCDVCGRLFADADATEEISEPQAVAATGHVEGDAVVENEVAASCTEDGSYDSVVYCSVCGEELSRETVAVAATGHTWDGGTVTKEATATEEGVVTYTCTVCGEAYEEAIAALGYSFSDVQDASAYYYGPVYAVAEAGYMTGMSDDVFGVGRSLNRQQMVTILYRIFASDDEQAAYGSTSDPSGYADNQTPLTDVEDGAYYTAAVDWAYDAGVATGYSTGAFGVGDGCSFQQFCTFLARALGEDGALTDAEAEEALSSFADGSKVAAYADNSVAYLCSEVYDDEGDTIVGGTAAGKLKPASSVSRERTATVVYRCMAAGLF